MPKSAPKAAYLAAFEQIMAGAIYVPEASRPPSGKEPGGRDAIRTQISSLTPTQMKVLGLIKLGKINKQIAYELSIGDSMVKAHVSEIMRKLNVRNRIQIALCASKLDFDRVGL